MVTQATSTCNIDQPTIVDQAHDVGVDPSDHHCLYLEYEFLQFPGTVAGGSNDLHTASLSRLIPSISLVERQHVPTSELWMSELLLDSHPSFEAIKHLGFLPSSILMGISFVQHFVDSNSLLNACFIQ